MRKMITLILLTFISCSSDLDQSDSFKITLDGFTSDLENKDTDNEFYEVTVSPNFVRLTCSLGGVYGNNLELLFTRKGEFVRGNLFFNGYGDGNYTFKNYRYFASNFFICEIIEINENTGKINMRFSGNLYENDLDLNSYSRAISGEITVSFLTSEDPILALQFQGTEQYCDCSINGEVWRPLYTTPMSTFWNEGPYEIKVSIAKLAPIGTHEIGSYNGQNNVSVRKFNPQTLTYEEFVVQGTVSYSYREFHGARFYSNIGTFSLNGVNSSNPQETIVIPDGVFRNYQQYF
ncbi:hypothetical protein [Flavobacterium sp.]|uniref:hypothetical protein n=1 Tax=Flavobacterium sp. TaxID=239 RepID=UPI003B9B6DD9